MGKVELKEDVTQKGIQSEDWLKMKKTKILKEDGRYVIFYSFPQEEVREKCQNSDGTQCSKNG